MGESLFRLLKENNLALNDGSHPDIIKELVRTDSFEDNWPTLHDYMFFMNTDFSSVWANPVAKREWWNFSVGQVKLMEKQFGALYDGAVYTWTIKKSKLKEEFGYEV